MQSEAVLKQYFFVLASNIRRWQQEMLLLNFILASTAFSDLVKYTYKNIHKVNIVNILQNNFATGKAKLLRLLEINIKYTYMFCHLKQNKTKLLYGSFTLAKVKHGIGPT